MADGQTAHAHHAFPGPAGDHVGGAELARLFVLAGAAPQAMHELVRGASRWHQIDSEVAASRLTAAPDWLRLDLRGWPDIGAQLAAHSDLTGFRQGLADAWQRVMAAPGPCGLIQNAPAGLDWAALSTALCRDAPLQALAFDHHRPDVAALDWPMRVALPATADGRALRERLMAPGWMPPLVQTVGLRSRQPVDAFVWPGTVSQALVALRRSAGRRASVVLVMGGIGRLAAPVSEALHELSQLCAAAIVAVHQPDDAVTPWALPSLVAELSHNTPWPLAIHRALRTPDTAPLVLADLRFALENRPLDAALRLAEVLRDQPGEAALAQRIETTAARWPWSRETDGATELAHLRRDIERRIGPVDLRRQPWSREAMAMAGPPDLAEAGADGDGAAPVEPEPSDPARHVKFNLLPLDPSAPLPDEPVLRPQADHR